MQRRLFLQGLAGSALHCSVSLHASAQNQAGKDKPRLLLIFLRGGYDACNLLIPNSIFYQEARPNIAIPPAQALSLNADWGLHPALRESMLPLYQSGQLAFIPFAGTHDLSRSHFETQDSMELGQALQGKRDLNSGFLARLAQVSGQQKQSFAFCEQLPLIMRGPGNIANGGMQSLGRSNLDQTEGELLRRMYGTTNLGRRVEEGFQVRSEVSQEMMSEEMQKANRNALPVKGFAQVAQRVAHLMREKYTLGFLDLGGWDTHVNQGGAQGQLADKFQQLAQGLLVWQQEMGPAWDNSVVVVLSEFGRTFRENGKRGTDHGHGSAYWVLGGAVRGGKILGEQQQINAAGLHQQRDLPVLNEYRALLGGLFTRMYGLRPAQLEQVFPGAPGRDWGLI